MKKILFCVLCFIMLISMAGCKDNDGKEVFGEISDVKIWSTFGTEKIIQNVQDIYNEESQNDANIDLVVVQGEYEGAQVIISTGEKKVEYTLSLENLTSAAGDVFDKENIEVFHEKYVSVNLNHDKTNTPLGNYPDALIPYKNIVDAKENIVNPNNNQGLYFRFKIPTDQKPGVYNGQAKIKIGGGEKAVDIKLVVEDLCVNEENHARSLFTVRGFYHKGELESSQRMVDIYNDFLYGYRINTSGLVVSYDFSDVGIQKYVDKAYEAMQNPTVNTIVIPFDYESVDGISCISKTVFEKFLKAFAKKSFENDFNMAKNLVSRTIDEPQYSETGRLQCIASATRYRETIEKVATELINDTTITSPVKSEFIDSMRKIPNIVTTYYQEDYKDYVDTWCPTYDFYDGERIHDYDNQEEKWWYGCISPRAPYPTYHTEDTLLSARLIGWMQAEYNVVGNLFWGVDLYVDYVGDAAGYYQEIEDYYEGDAERYDKVNGDGYLCYPGKKYGIDGPIGSLRLEAIRDGIEEYELFYNMMQKYETINNVVSNENSEYSFSSNYVVKSITGQLYNGTKVSANSMSFYSARKSLFELAKLNDAIDFCILNHTDDNCGNITDRILVDASVVVKSKGNIIIPDATIGDYSIYTIKTQLKDKENYLELSFEKDSKNYAYSVYLGGNAETYLFDNCSSSNFTRGTVMPSVEVVNGSYIGSEFNFNVIKLSVPSAYDGETEWPISSFVFSSDMLNMVGENTSKMILRLYQSEDAQNKITISAKFKNDKIQKDLITTTLCQGVNQIEISLDIKNWSKLGDMEKLTFYIGEKDSASEYTISLIDCIFYNK